MVRKLIVTLIVIAAVLAAIDYGARLYSQRVVAEQVQASLQLVDRPKVTFGGWPFIPHALSGNLPSATVTATEFRAQGVTLNQVVLSLEDVHFSSHRMFTKGYGKVQAKRGSLTAVLTQTDLNQTLRSEGLPLTVTFQGGTATATVAGASLSVHPSLDGDTLVLTTGSVSARIGLPTPMRGMHYTQLKVGGGEISLTASAGNVLLILPK